MTKFFLLILSFTFLGCAATTRFHAPLVQQIVRMRPGYKNLTHRICAETAWTGKCNRWDIVEYDLNDAALRKKLVSLQFRCVIAGFRYKIDPDQPRFIRYQIVSGGMFGKDTVRKVNPVDFSETEFLIDSAAACYSERTYPEGLNG